MIPGETVETTSDERVMAALSHFFGLIAALIVWATQKDKSRFVRFQALQAMAFDALVMVGYLLFMFCMMSFIFIALIAGVFATAQAAPSDNLLPGMVAGMLVPWAMITCVTPLILIASIVRIVAAVSVATGHKFRYPWLASRVEAFLREPVGSLSASAS